MKRDREASLIALMLVAAGAFAPAASVAQDLRIDASTTPPAPWTPYQPVRLVLTVQNLGATDALAFIWLDGLNRSNRLVRAIVPRPESTGACTYGSACPDFSVHPDDLFFCVQTTVIAPLSSRTCSFDLIAFPDANGGVLARFYIDPIRPPGFPPVIGDDPANNTIILPFAYGAVGVSHVPTLHAWGLWILMISLVVAAVVQIRARLRIPRLPTT